MRRLIPFRLLSVSALLMMLSPTAEAGQLTLNYTFDCPQVTTVRIGDTEYHRVIMEGATNGGPVGSPALPASGARILLPLGAEVTSVEVIAEERVLLGSDLLVEPVGQPYRLMDGPQSAAMPTPDPAIYGSAEMYPGVSFEEIGAQSFRGYQILVLRLQPVGYVPSTGELSYNPSLQVVVETAETDKVPAMFRGFDGDASEVHRRVDNPALIAAILAAGEQPAGAPPGVWEVVETIMAQQEEQYIALAPTLADSATYSVYYISAHTTMPATFFDSPVDSGYSVDNIAPGVPEGFAVAYNTGSGNQLNWDVSSAPDFQYFKIYRSTDPGFTPGPGNEVHATADPYWTDPEYDGWDVHYKITALDHAGNESPAASPGTATGTKASTIPTVFALHQNVPNPFNPATTIGYDVPPGGGVVTLRVYDVAGRLVRTLVDESQPAGQKTIHWTGTNDLGSRVASGMYFYRMTAPGFTETRKMVLLQ